MNEIPLLILLLVLSGFFSGAEIAFFSLGAEKIRALKNSAKTPAEKRRIARLEKLKSDPNPLLVTILIGSNVVNVAASAMATIFAMNLADSFGVPRESSLVIGTVTGVMTLLLLLFCEIIPKSIAHRHALKFANFSAPILSALQFALFPAVWILAKFVHKFSGEHAIGHGLDENELKAAIELSEREGKIDRDEREWVENILEFDEHSVESVMTPRSKVFTLPGKMPLPLATQKITESGFSRVPIVGETPDEILGIFTIRAVAEAMQNPDFERQKITDLDLDRIFRVPPAMKIDACLREFQKRKTKGACVFDAHGGWLGWISLEDIFEEIFGEFWDENDEIFFIRETEDQKFIADGEIELEQIEHFWRKKKTLPPDVRTPWKLEDENKTLAEFLLEKFGKFPNLNAKIDVKNDEIALNFQIKKLENGMIKEVEIIQEFPSGLSEKT